MSAVELDPTWVEALRTQLLDWFQHHQRTLPWRGVDDPYYVWVSEIMLQQTQVATVIPYFERFIQRFPTVQALAEAQLDEVLKYWEGLGYYSRARNLWRSAQQIVANGGELPRSVDRLRELPGIGAYTAGAIASIAFNLPEPLVDGNVTRVLARLLWLKGNLKSGKAQKLLWQIARQLVDPQCPGDFNQALMELGSTVCLPALPNCAQCPVQSLCSAYQRGQPTAVPEVTPSKPARQVVDVSAMILRENTVLLAQRPVEGLWGGLWEFPRATRTGRESVEQLAMQIGTRHHLQVQPIRVVESVKHAVTYSRIVLYGVLCRYQSGTPTQGDYQHIAWVPIESLGEYPLSAPQRQLADRLETSPTQLEPRSLFEE
ncbi:MAG: A/G-specific adenine glycosylase [Fimbriimonadales bacterium]